MSAFVAVRGVIKVPDVAVKVPSRASVNVKPPPIAIFANVIVVPVKGPRTPLKSPIPPESVVLVEVTVRLLERSAPPA
jgi:hypothetical protein